MAFSTVINPKHTVDLILRFGKDKNEEEVDNNSDLTDAESRLLAVYDIIRKGIENKDVYLVVKCLNMINKNWDEYWVFRDKENVKNFKEIMYNLYNKYMDKCKEEHFFEKGNKAFKILLGDYYIYIKDIENRINNEDCDILDNLNNIKQKINSSNDKRVNIELLKDYLIELTILYAKKCKCDSDFEAKLNKFNELIEKCNELIEQNNS